MIGHMKQTPGTPTNVRIRSHLRSPLAFASALAVSYVVFAVIPPVLIWPVRGRTFMAGILGFFGIRGGMQGYGAPLSVAHQYCSAYCRIPTYISRLAKAYGLNTH